MFPIHESRCLACVRRGATALFTLGVVFTSPLRANEPVDNATRDAEKVTSCMQSFDAACVIDMTYSKFLEEHGFSPQAMAEKLAGMYQQIKSMKGRFTRFRVRETWKPLRVGQTWYTFIPYECTLVEGQLETSEVGNLIGISEDGGASWKFIDGMQFSEKNIRQIIPGYEGSLPPISINQTSLPDQ